MQTIKANGYFFIETGKPLEKRDFEISSIKSDEAVVKISGCGLCHTDMGFYQGHVKTNSDPPLILGHEISGEVVEAGSEYENLKGYRVIIPAVLPCGECELCSSGRSNVCRKQKMPGNDFNGGFASHIKVPARFLCKVPDDTDIPLSEFSVVADAVTTPYQSLKRTNLKESDLAIVIGVGGIGTYMVQLAKDAGAKVIAADIDEAKLENAKKLGADYTVNAKDKTSRDIKGEVRNLVKENGLPKFCWKVYETSGTAPGQETAFSLLTFAGVVAIVGFTTKKIEVRLSNIMAFDADLVGNWGCKPEYYPDVVDLVLKKRINISDNVVEYSLDEINDVIKLTLDHKLDKRAILKP